ncbi:unnamed protein product [Chilo suppressalis]|uniref:Integrase catalytic domain-containing protein n=1 Tax=Chilo suppressalis TaxID=168631 RepID=A0ABN8B8C0_CHISP|nr:unnamed protein product [Chilo suppressalis]
MEPSRVNIKKRRISVKLQESTDTSKMKTNEFDDTEAFTKYCAELRSLHNKDPNSFINLVTKNMVHETLKKVSVANRKVESNLPLSKKEKNLLKIYDIVDGSDDGETSFLVINSMVTEHKDQKLRRVISCEEAFSVILNIHRKGRHCSFGALKFKLSELNLYIYEESFCISLVINLCSICTPKFNTKSYIYVARTIEQDGEFKYVLTLVDDCTKYIRLRPLTSVTESEIAIELFKTFMDFGIPKYIFSPLSASLEKVFTIMKSLCPDHSMPIIQKCGGVSGNFQSLILNKLEEYRIEKGITNWAILCHMVQWNINTTTHYENVLPYHAVFGRHVVLNMPNVDVKVYDNAKLIKSLTKLTKPKVNLIPYPIYITPFGKIKHILEKNDGLKDTIITNNMLEKNNIQDNTIKGKINNILENKYDDNDDDNTKASEKTKNDTVSFESLNISHSNFDSTEPIIDLTEENDTPNNKMGGDNQSLEEKTNIQSRRCHTCRKPIENIKKHYLQKKSPPMLCIGCVQKMWKVFKVPPAPLPRPALAVPSSSMSKETMDFEEEIEKTTIIIKK